MSEAATRKGKGNLRNLCRKRCLPSHLLVATLGADLVEKVGAVEALLEDLGVGHVQLGEDVGLDARRGGGGQGHHRRVGKLGAQGAQAGVVGAEVVAPLADAVGLVDNKAAQVALGVEAAQDLHEAAGAADALWCHVEQLAALDVRVQQIKDLLLLVGRLRARQVLCADAVLRQRRHLVLNQRNQRRDDNRHARLAHSRQLVAKALAATRRHQHKCVHSFCCWEGRGGLEKGQAGVSK